MLSLLTQLDLSQIESLQNLTVVGILMLVIAVAGYLILFTDTLITGKRHKEVIDNYERLIEIKDQHAAALKEERDALQRENSEQNKDLLRLTEDFKSLFRDVISTRLAASFRRSNGEDG